MPFLKGEFTKTMAQRVSAKPKPPKSNVLLYPVLSAEVLLAHPKRWLSVEKIKHQCGLDTSSYELLYQTLIYDVVEFVQALPFYIGDKPGSLMDYSLRRAADALRYYRESNSDFNILYAYAVFTLALLQDIGKVIGQQKVIISDEHGHFMGEWLPTSGCLVGQSDYYKIRFLGDQWVSLGQAMTPLLARQLIPSMGFDWLAQDHNILQMWLAALMGNAEQGGDLYKLLQLINKQFLESLNKEQNQLPPLAIEIPQEEETLVSEDFLAWLKWNVENNQITVNEADSPLQVLKDGSLFLDQKIFELFCDPKRLDVMGIAREFNFLIGVEEVRFEKFYAKYGGPISTARVTKMGGSPYFLAGKSAAAASGAGERNMSAGSPMVREGMVIAKEKLAFLNTKLPTSSSATVQLQAAETTKAAIVTLEQTKLNQLLDKRAMQRQRLSQGKTY